MSTTTDNLWQALNEDSRVHHIYLAFADTAEAEGYPQVARLFRAAAQAKSIQARNHLRALATVGTTPDNLREAMARETREGSALYPRRLADAQAAGEEGARRSFLYAQAGEKRLAALFQDALDSLGELSRIDLCVCSVCGATLTGAVPAVCPICRTDKKFFHRLD